MKGTLAFEIWFVILTLSGGFYLKTGNELFQFFPATFWASSFPTIVLSYAEACSKFLITFRAAIVVTGHASFLLSS